VGFGGVDQFLQARQPFTHALVRAGLGVLLELGQSGEVAGAHRAGDRVRHPVRVLQRPLGDVEVEGAHAHQHSQAVAPLDRCLARPGPGVGDALAPLLGDLRGQTQRVDAAVVGLQVAPEVADQSGSEAQQGAVVQGRPAFVEVAGQNLADHGAAHLVAVNKLSGRQLPLIHPAQRQGLLKHSGLTQQVPSGVEARGDLPPGGQMPVAHVQQVRGTELVQVPTGVQDQFGQGALGVGPVLLREPCSLTGAGDGSERLRAESLLGAPNEGSGAVGVEEAVVRQHYPAQQQRGQAIGDSGVRTTAEVREPGGNLSGPGGLEVRARKLPPLLPALPAMARQPGQHPPGALAARPGSAVALFTSRDGGCTRVWEAPVSTVG